MTDVACSFCGKQQNQVKRLIGGPGVYICDECVRLCSDIIDHEVERGDSPEQDSAPVPPKGVGGWRAYSSSNPPPLPLALNTIKRQLDDMSERVEVLAKRAEQQSSDP